MPEFLKKYIIISSVFHFLLILSFYIPSFFNTSPKTSNLKITKIILSKGDGGTNTKANLKNNKNLPDYTPDQQKRAQRIQKKKKQQQKNQKYSENFENKKTKKRVKKRVKKKKVTKRNQSRKINKNAGINTNKRSSNRPVNKKEADALASIDNILKNRNVPDVQQTAAQTKGDTGQSPWGSDQGTTVNPELIKYHNDLKRRIRKEWILSDSSSGQHRAKITVQIDQNGKVIRSEVKKSSGNASFDQGALRAIQRASPFPIPPDSIKNEAFTEGFLIDFYPKKKS